MYDNIKLSARYYRTLFQIIFYMAIGQRVNQFIKFKRIRQTELGEILELSRGTINQALNEDSNFTTKSLVRLAEHFPELSARWLLTGKGTMMSDGNTSEIQESSECKALRSRIEDLENTIQSMSMTIDAKDEIIGLLKKT